MEHPASGGSSIDEQQLDDEATTMSPGALAGFLQDRLGQNVAARLVGLGDAKQLGRYRKGDGPTPRPMIELRMREAYKLVDMITRAFDDSVARAWLLGTNSRLGGRAPIDVFREAGTAEGFRPVRAAGRQFLISEATVRDPLADVQAVRAARTRPMAERLEVSLSWNLVASELRAGLIREQEAGG